MPGQFYRFLGYLPLICRKDAGCSLKRIRRLHFHSDESRITLPGYRSGFILPFVSDPNLDITEPHRKAVTRESLAGAVSSTASVAAGSEPTIDSSDSAKLPFFRRLRNGFRFPRSWKDVKALGWKAILAFVIFYLIRDSILYILIPYLIYRGVIG